MQNQQGVSCEPLYVFAQPSYQDLTRVRNPTQHVYAATHSLPDGSRRLIYGRYEGGRDTAPLPLQVPSDIHHSWSELRRKLPRDSLDTSLAEDVSESSERIERMSQKNRLPDGDQIHRSESREEGGRAFRGHYQSDVLSHSLSLSVYRKAGYTGAYLGG